MNRVTGKVEAISVKPLDQEDQFGNTHRASIKMDDGNWYSMGSMKSDKFTVMDDERKWRELGVGSEVLLKFEENGDYRNSKRSLITVLDFVAGSSSGKPKPVSKVPAQSSGGVDWNKRDAGIEAGHAINGAIQFIVNNPKLSIDDLIPIATQVHQATRELQSRILEGGTKKKEDPTHLNPPLEKDVSNPKKPPKGKPKNEDEPEWVDDDVPF